jgi:predicted transcriptional regulator
MTNALVKVAAEASLEEVCEVMRRCDSEQIVIVDCGEVFGFVLLEEVLLVLVNERAQRIRYLIDYITHG